MMNQKTIKTGNPFATYFVLRNGITREPIEITNEMVITCDLINSSGQKIATCEVVVMDQATQKGGVQLKVAHAITATWKTGTVTGDVKFAVNGVPTNSDNFSFKVIRSIT